MKNRLFQAARLDKDWTKTGGCNYHKHRMRKGKDHVADQPDEDSCHNSIMNFSIGQVAPLTIPQRGILDG